MASIPYPTKLNSLSLPPDQATSVITSISSLPSITGSTKTEYTTNIKLKLKELNFTLSQLSIMPVCSTSLDFTLLVQSVEWTDGPDTTEILIWKSTSQNYHQQKSSKSFGMVPQSSLEDLPNKKLNKKTSIQLKPFSIKAQKSFWLQLEEAAFWSVQQSAPIWVVFQFHIWVTITDGSAFATVQFMTNSVESDKVQPFKTYHTSTTQFMRTEH